MNEKCMVVITFDKSQRQFRFKILLGIKPKKFRNSSVIIKEIDHKGIHHNLFLQIRLSCEIFSNNRRKISECKIETKLITLGEETDP